MPSPQIIQTGQIVQTLFTPKQVAKAIGVSESSLKRWCDQGVIQMAKTAGGHRRLPIQEVMRFLRESGHSIVDPAVLGLPSLSGQGERVVARSRLMFRDALVSGNEEVARRVLYDLYLSNIPLSQMIDQVFAGAFEDIGNAWECGQIDIFEERRGCQIAQKVLFELTAAIPYGLPNAPLAMGGTCSGDQYTLATICVEHVFRSLGWRATSLGTNIPFESLKLALIRSKPKIFWISASYIEDIDQFREGINSLYDLAESMGTALLLGGRTVDVELRKTLRYTAFADSMQHLEAFAKTQYVPPQPEMPTGESQGNVENE